MGRPEKEGRCRRHPSHKHSNGVCPYCLHDRLAGLSSSSASSTANALSSTASSTVYSSYDSDSSSAATPSPEEQRRTNMRLSQLIKGAKYRLRKSSSLAGTFVKEAAERKEKVKEKMMMEKKKKKKKGMKFFAKLLMAGGGRTEERDGGLSHSKTMKEKPSSKWPFFS